MRAQRPAATLEEIAALAPAGDRDLARAVHPGGGRHLGRGDPTLRARPPILGVCLGHQAIGAAYGAEVVRARRLMHGKTSPVAHRGEGLFAGLPVAVHGGALPLAGDRARSRCPPELEVMAWTDEAGYEDEIQAVRHREHPVWGVQFHPESIASEHGRGPASQLPRAGVTCADERSPAARAPPAARPRPRGRSACASRAAAPTRRRGCGRDRAARRLRGCCERDTVLAAGLPTRRGDLVVVGRRRAAGGQGGRLRRRDRRHALPAAAGASRRHDRAGGRLRVVSGLGRCAAARCARPRAPARSCAGAETR